MPKIVFEEKMHVSYKNMNGQIVFIDKSYVTFNPLNSAALLVIYREDWQHVTIL